MEKYQELKEHYNDIERHYIVREYTDKDIENLSVSIRQNANRDMFFSIIISILLFICILPVSRAYYLGKFTAPLILEFLICQHPIILPAVILLNGLCLYASAVTKSPKKLIVNSMQTAAKKFDITFTVPISDKGILVQIKDVIKSDNLLDWCALVLTIVIKVHPEATGEIHRLMDNLRGDDKTAYTAAVIYTEILNDQLVQGNESFIENGETNFCNYCFFDDDECNITKYFN